MNNNCNCGAQDRAEHRPHNDNCNVYAKNPEQQHDDFDTQIQIEELEDDFDDDDFEDDEEGESFY